MRLLANENFPRQMVEALRDSGHDVTWIRTDAPGSQDEDVLRRSIDEDRILITFDKDIGELTYKAGQQASCGIILFRVPLVDLLNATLLVVSTINSRDDWQGHFSVVKEGRVRIRKLK